MHYASNAFSVNPNDISKSTITDKQNKLIIPSNDFTEVKIPIQLRF